MNASPAVFLYTRSLLPRTLTPPSASPPFLPFLFSSSVTLLFLLIISSISSPYFSLSFLTRFALHPLPAFHSLSIASFLPMPHHHPLLPLLILLITIPSLPFISTPSLAPRFFSLRLSSSPPHLPPLYPCFTVPTSRPLNIPGCALCLIV